MDQSAGNYQYYDQKTGGFIAGNGPDKSFFDESIITRLRKHGMPDSEIRKVLKDPARLASIQQTMSNTGLNPEPTTVEQKAQAAYDNVKKQMSDQINAGLSVDPAAFEAAAQQAKAAEAAQAQAKAVEDKLAADKARQDAASAGASATAEGKTTGVSTPSTIKTDTTNQTQQNTTEDPVRTALIRQASRLPGSDLYTATLDTLETQKANDLATIDAQKKLGMISEQTAYDNTKSYLAEVKSRREELFKQAKADADRNYQEQQDMLASREQAQKQQLNWQRDQETQKMEKEKTQQVLQESISLALRGGFGSGAGNKQIAETERTWDNAISNLQTEYAFKQSDVSAQYTQLYVQANKQHRSDLRDAASSYSDALDKIDQTYFANDTAYKKAIANIESDYMKGINEAGKTYTNGVLGLVKDITSSIAAERRAQATEDRADQRQKDSETRQDNTRMRQVTQQRLTLSNQSRTNLEQIESYKVLQKTDYRIMNIESLYDKIGRAHV